MGGGGGEELTSDLRSLRVNGKRQTTRGFSSSKHLVNTVPSSHGKTTKVEHDTGCNHDGRSFFSLAINNNWGLKSRSTLDYKEIQKHMTGRQQSKMQHSSQATECAIIKTLDIFQKQFRPKTHREQNARSYFQQTAELLAAAPPKQRHLEIQLQLVIAA